MRSKKPLNIDEMIILIKKHNLYKKKNTKHRDKKLRNYRNNWVIRVEYIDNSLENPFSSDIKIGYHRTITKGNHFITSDFLFPNLYGSKKKARRELNRIRKYYKYVKGFDVLDIRVVKYDK